MTVLTPTPAATTRAAMTTLGTAMARLEFLESVITDIREDLQDVIQGVSFLHSTELSNDRAELIMQSLEDLHALLEGVKGVQGGAR